MAKLKGMFNGFWRYRYLLWNLVSRDFKLKYRRSVLGVLWSVLNPLLMCLVYWAVFSSLMDMRGSDIDNRPDDLRDISKFICHSFTSIISIIFLIH